MPQQNTDKQNSHYARLRRDHRAKQQKIEQKSKKRGRIDSQNKENKYNFANSIYLYGIHTVLAAIKNKRREIYLLLVTENIFKKLSQDKNLSLPKLEIVSSKELSKLIGDSAVHQGIVAIAKPLKTKNIADCSDEKIVVLLDQITDPHNVGAIIRNCVASDVNVLITTRRHGATETGVLAKSASGGYDMIEFVTVKNLSETILELKDMGFYVIGLDSAGEDELNNVITRDKPQKIALILGSEGKGIREKTRLLSNKLAKLSMPGRIKSLNVSNACAISLYVVRNYIESN